MRPAGVGADRTRGLPQLPASQGEPAAGGIPPTSSPATGWTTLSAFQGRLSSVRPTRDTFLPQGRRGHVTELDLRQRSVPVTVGGRRAGAHGPVHREDTTLDKGGPTGGDPRGWPLPWLRTCHVAWGSPTSFQASVSQ